MSNLPEHVTPIDKNESFLFSCHHGVTCFTECCRKLELALSPYDVLRLKKFLGISSQEFLDQYAIVEFLDHDLHPKVYLGMVDDGRASCPFVEKSGCKVYTDRPGPCRTYPLARGAYQDANGLQEIFVILREPHCQGLSQEHEYTVQSWHTDQGLKEYNEHNDILLPIFNSEYFKAGNRLNQEEADLFILTLYNIDIFIEKYPELFSKKITDDKILLRTIVQWLGKKLFSQNR